MNSLTSVLQWFTGGSDHQYMLLYQCMKRDWFWISLTVALDLSVACGYILIALHWSRNSRYLPDIPAKRALARMRNIFVFCGICGYVFLPIKMLWPAWRLYDITMLFLVYTTWRYAWNARELKVVYSELGRSKQLEDDLEKSRLMAQRKTSFLNAVSHDLRTPLNGLMLQSSLAEIGYESNDPDTVKQALVEIRSTAAAAASLLDSLLDYAKMEIAGEQNSVSQFVLGEMLERITSRCRASAEQKGLHLQMGSCNGLAISTDRLKLDRIVTNLVDNAIKFTKQGGIRIDVEQAGKGVEIHVVDSGVGIDPAMQPRLFEEFFQVHNNERDRKKGFGMGLAIARRLAQQLGGDVVVDSAVGRGSRFSVCLPDAVFPTEHAALQPVPLGS